MSLEDTMAELTAAIKEQTAFLKSMKGGGGSPTEASVAAKAAAGKKSSGKITLDTIKEKFGTYLGVEDKAERKERIANVTAIVDHFGVKKASELEEENWAEALGYLKQFEAGETPDFMDEGGGDGEALV